jgi:hypothetical protein
MKYPSGKLVKTLGRPYGIKSPIGVGVYPPSPKMNVALRWADRERKRSSQ